MSDFKNTWFDNAVHMMELIGGGFVKSLAACYYSADTTNKARLRKAFSDYFERYEAQYRDWKAMQKPDPVCSFCLESGCGGECSGDGQMGG